MNEATHFFTGYLLGTLGFKKKNDHFLPFFIAMAAILPDIDQFLHLIIPIDIFEHAVATHTILGALILTSAYTLIIWTVGRKFFLDQKINLSFLFLMAILGMSSHLFLDIFTYREDIYTTNAHLYFWPVWNISIHLNYFFHQDIFPNIYTVRILIEVIYSVVIGSYILFYQWYHKKESPFAMLFPKNWLTYLPEEQAKERYRTVYGLFFVNLAILAVMAISLFF